MIRVLTVGPGSKGVLPNKQEKGIILFGGNKGSDTILSAGQGHKTCTTEVWHILSDIMHSAASATRKMKSINLT